MSPIEPTTNFRDSNGVDLGTKLITKDYLISVYPSLAPSIGIDPELWVWGSSADGVLGNGTAGGPLTPVTTSAGGTNWKQVSSNRHTAAIKTDGTLWTWGRAVYGTLGTNNTTQRDTPVTTFSGGTNWKQVSVGRFHTAAIKTDGTLWTWGYGLNGALGNNATTNRSTPVTTFVGGNNWKQVSCGRTHVAAIKTDGTLWVWGQGNAGQLGTNDVSNRNTPSQTTSGGTNWKQVSTGSAITAAVKTDGTLWTWGSAIDGALGNAVTTGSRNTPVTTFAGGTNWKLVNCGYSHMAAIKTDGTLWTWGAGSYGRLGNNVQTARSTPVTTSAGGTNWKQVSGGFRHTAAIKTDGTLWTWGYGLSGRLGNNSTLRSAAPVTTFAGGTNWKQVSSGDAQTLAIESVDF
jgi:alpha-tubulin suppressor-like RCC1 family protein